MRMIPGQTMCHLTKGKYTGFGNPACKFGSEWRTLLLGGIYEFVVQNSASKKDIAELNDIINDPMQALSKGWSLLSVGVDGLSKAAVGGAKYAAQSAEQITKYANENYVRPGSQHLADPNLRNNVSAYVSNLTKKK